MTKRANFEKYLEFYEYHGNTSIERVRKKGGVTILRDWIIFDTVEEAAEYFNNDCGL